jgi:CRP/FNR family cyclic AMP-dependent transcriptional regulator
MDIDRPWRRQQTLQPDLGTSVRLPAGTRLVTEGTPGAEFFVVEHGHAAVHRRGYDIAVLGPGDHFGEIALLEPRTPRTASVTAAEDLQVQVYDRREFATLLDRDPIAAVGILRHAVERLLAA